MAAVMMMTCPMSRSADWFRAGGAVDGGSVTGSVADGSGT
jgi:hypothetical protein